MRACACVCVCARVCLSDTTRCDTHAVPCFRQTDRTRRTFGNAALCATAMALNVRCIGYLFTYVRSRAWQQQRLSQSQATVTTHKVSTHPTEVALRRAVGWGARFTKGEPPSAPRRRAASTWRAPPATQRRPRELPTSACVCGTRMCNIHDVQARMRV